MRRTIQWCERCALPADEHVLLCSECDTPLEADRELGRVLEGRWKLLALIGRGAMGRVYRAKHVVLGRQVAIKLLAPEFARHEEVRNRFQREALAASRLAHPHVAATLDFGLADDTPYLVMELVEGQSLEEYIEENGPLDWKVSLVLIRQLAHALGVAHEFGMVHRDVKPGNVLILDSGLGLHAKLTDFGIVHLEGKGQQKLTTVGQTLGTPDFMPPEQIMGKQVDARADVYALGATLYQALTAQALFPSSSLSEILGAQLTKRPEAPSKVQPAIPQQIDDLVLNLLEKDPSLRPKNGLEVAQTAEQLLESLGAEVEEEHQEEPHAVVVLGRPDKDHVPYVDLLVFEEVVQREGRVVAQTLRRETVAVLPNAEAGARVLLRFREREAQETFRLALHLGKVDDAGKNIVAGDCVHQALELARLASDGETLISRIAHDELGGGMRARLERRGQLNGGDPHLRALSIFGLRGSHLESDESVIRGAQHGEFVEWTCSCHTKGKVPHPGTVEWPLRVRCPGCSGLLRVEQSFAQDTTTLGASSKTDQLVSYGLSHSQPPPSEQVLDQELLSALTDGL